MILKSSCYFKWEMSARNSGKTPIFSFDMGTPSRKNSAHRDRERVTPGMASALEVANSMVASNASIPAASTLHTSTQATNQVESTATVRNLADTGYVKL